MGSWVGQSGNNAAWDVLKACLACHIFCIVDLIVLICFLDHVGVCSLVISVGWAQHSFASLSCLTAAVSGHSCRKCHRVSDVGRPWLRQYVHALRMHTSVGRWGSPALRPCPPHSNLEIVIDALLLIDWWWRSLFMSCPSCEKSPVWLGFGW